MIASEGTVKCVIIGVLLEIFYGLVLPGMHHALSLGFISSGTIN